MCDASLRSSGFRGLYWWSDRAESLPFDHLPRAFALKANHGSGWNILVEDKQAFSRGLSPFRPAILDVRFGAQLELEDAERDVPIAYRPEDFSGT